MNYCSSQCHNDIRAFIGMWFELVRFSVALDDAAAGGKRKSNIEMYNVHYTFHKSEERQYYFYNVLCVQYVDLLNVLAKEEKYFHYRNTRIVMTT